MKKLFLILVLSIFASMLFAMPASAIGFLAGENLIIEDDLNEDYYIAGGVVTIEGNINADLYVAGGEITIEGDIAEDLVVAGGRVTLRGDVGDDVRSMGGQVMIAGNVGDDVIVMGGQVDVSKESLVGGSLICGAGYLTMEGEVMEDIQGGVGMLILRGLVHGDVIVSVEEKIDLDENAKIMGDLKYSAILETEIPENVVDGEIHFNKFEEKHEELEQVTNTFMTYRILRYVSALLLVLLLVAFAPNMLIEAAKTTREHVWKTFGIGILTTISVFVGALILMGTIIGIPLGLIAFGTLFLIFYLSKIFVVAWVSAYIINYKKPKKNVRLPLFVLMAVFLAAYYLVGMIPYVGWALSIILFLIGVGAITMTLQRQISFLRAKKML